METNAEKVKFEFTIPYNHPVLVKERKQTKILYAVACLLIGLGLARISLYLYEYRANEWVYNILFLLGIAALFCTVIPFVVMRPRPRDAERMIKMTFLEDGLEVIQDNTPVGGKVKNLKNCQYRKHVYKQYVRYVYEYPDRIQLRILTAHTNLAPSYVDYSVPKDIVVGEHGLNEFKQFLQDKVGKDYKIKKK